MGNCSSENSNQVDTRVHTKLIESAIDKSDEKLVEPTAVSNVQSSRVASRAQSSTSNVEELNDRPESKLSNLNLKTDDNIVEKLESTNELDQ